MILRTRNPRDPNRIAGLTQLCAQFSMALFAFARRKGMSADESGAAVRDFLEHVRGGNLTIGRGPSWERLRNYLLCAFEEFLSIRHVAGADASRGASRAAENFSEAEAWFQAETETTDPAERTFNRAWARCILLQSLSMLQSELASDHGGHAAEIIAAELSPGERRPFDTQLADRLDLSASEVLQILRASRRRLRELILTTLRETVSAATDLDIEFWDLFRSV